MSRASTGAGRWAVAGALLLSGALPARAQYHSPSTLVCSDCHTIHYSEEGGPAFGAPGGPFPNLLRAATTNQLCLACHDGTDPTAPDVVFPVGMYAGTGDEHSAAGCFANSGGIVSPLSHDLEVAPVAPPLSASAPAMTLTCATCHEPHGTANYRNLISNPDGGGGGVTLVLGTDVFQGVAPALPPTVAGTRAAYRRSNIGYKSNYSAWCARCHDLLASNAAGSSPAHFQRHPSNVPLNGGGYHASPSNWILGTPNGVQAGEGATGDATFGIPRVRFQVPTAIDHGTATAVAASNEVFCGSCHLAHGWNYRYGLVMPYREGGADMYAGCIQCHNK